ncbi:MAG: hypothetical protein SGJ20_11205 [Planctomycetota bacterium]|nr:hypothetical protein [Planctomycetota bacterium]
MPSNLKSLESIPKHDDSAASSKYWLDLLRWDGLLPLTIALSIRAVALLLPPRHILEVVVAFFLPLIAALIRAHVGANQIRKACGGALPRRRQFVLAVAIVFLFLCECGTAIVILADDEPEYAWTFPVVFYIAYLACVLVAFLPQQKRMYE